MGPARWLTRFFAVMVVALAMGLTASWLVSRGYLFDLLQPALRNDPAYSLMTSLMPQRRQRKFDVVSIGYPEFVDQISSALPPCVRNLAISLPAYHYAELNRTLTTLRPFEYDYLLIDNNPAFWSGVRGGRAEPQKREAWRGVRRRQQPFQIRHDLRIAFSLITDAAGPVRAVKKPSAVQLARAYSKARIHKELARWDQTGTVARALKKVGHDNVFWFMGFQYGPFEADNGALRAALEQRFTQQRFDPKIGHLFSVEDSEKAAQLLAARICES